MQEAYTYEVIYSNEIYLVYTQEALLGTLQKKMYAAKGALLEIKNDQYKLETSGFINPVISITNIATGQLLGKIKISGIGRIFSKVVFEYNNIALKWVNKSLFSLHWQWKKGNIVIIETIENFKVGQQKGVIVLSGYFDETNLLIMLGVFLRNNTGIFSLPLRRRR